MSQRDRQAATLIIWIVFLFMMLFVFDQVLRVPADFAGLWPQQELYPTAHDAAALNEIIATAREATPDILERVSVAIREQMALRVPLVTVLTALIMLAASLCTWFIWRNAGLEAYLAREAVQAEKAKRRSRIEQFMDDLEPDELDQLRARLEDDGSITAGHDSRQSH